MNSELEAAFFKLEKRKTTLLKKLEAIDDEQLQMRPAERSWSVVQVLHHLADSERGSLLYCMKKINAGSQMPDAHFTNDLRMRLFNLFLYTPIKYKKPQVIQEPDENLNYPDVCIHWYNTRESWHKFLASYPDEYLNKAIFKHPVAGRISLKSTLWFFEAHLRHHEYQIDRILKNITAS